MLKRLIPIGLLILCIGNGGCFYPPTTQPPAEDRKSVV